MLEDIFSSNLEIYNPILVSIMHGAHIINVFLQDVYILQGLLDSNIEGIDIFDRVFIIFFVDFSVMDDFKDDVYMTRSVISSFHIISITHTRVE